MKSRGENGATRLKAKIDLVFNLCTALKVLWNSEHSLMSYGVTEESTAAAPVAALIELGLRFLEANVVVGVALSRLR